MSAHGTLRAAGVDFGTDQRLRVDQRVAARERILAGLARRPAAQPQAAPTTPTEAGRPAARRQVAKRRRGGDRTTALRTAILEDIAAGRLLSVAAIAAERAQLEQACAELTALLEEADADVRMLVGDQPDDLAEVVRSFLSARHRRYPGVQQDIAAALDAMAVLSGWQPDAAL